MNTAPEGIPSEAGDHHEIRQRPRYTNIHRHPTEKICNIPKINTLPSDLNSAIQDSA